MKLCSDFTLKIMAIVFIAMDSISTYIGSNAMGAVPVWFGYLGKLATPILFYLIVDGFFYTNSRVKYIKKLLLMGVLMIGVDWALGIGSNIFISLGLDVAMISGIEYIKTQKIHSKGFIIGIISVLLIAIGSYNTDASINGIVMVLIFYFLREKKALMVISYVTYSLIPLVAFSSDYQWMMVFAIIPILLYKSKKVTKATNFTTRVLYWFYPVHLIAIVAISRFVL